MAKFKRRIWHQIVIIAIIPLVLGGFLFYTLWVQLGEVEQAAREEQIATECANQVNQNILVCADGANDFIHFMRERSHEDAVRFADKMEGAAKRLRDYIGLNRANEDERKYLQANLKLFTVIHSEVDDLAGILASGHLNAMEAYPRIRGMLNLAAKLRENNDAAQFKIADEMAQKELALKNRQASVQSLALNGFLFWLLATLIVASIVRRSIISRILSLRQYVDALVRGNAVPLPIGGSDEIAELEQAFASMSKSIRTAIRREQAAMQSASVVCTLDSDGKIRSSTRPIDFGSADRARFDSATEESRRTLQPVIMEIGTTSWSCRWNAADGLFYCIGHDISELKRREEALRANRERVGTLMDSMPAALFLTSDAGTIVRVNQESAELLRIPAAQIVGSKLSEFCEVSRIQQRGSTQRLQVQDTWCEVSVDVLDESHEKLVVALNVDEQIKMEQMRDRLKAMIAHDIAAPLTSIQGAFKSIEKGRYGEVDEVGLQRAQVGAAETGRLMALFKDFIAIEKHNANEWTVNFESLELSEIVSQSVASVRALAEKAKVTVTIESVATAKVNADRNRLIQLLVNLLSNALKFSPENSTIHVGSVCDGDGVRISVRDEGTGIPEHLFQTIFEPFKQAAVTDSTVKGGSGLGLAICKSIVDSHQGKISVVNSAAGGAEFIVELPVIGEKR